jgi:hypothetical protein
MNNTVLNESVSNTETNTATPKPSFQWEAPVLYTEDWLQTLGGGITDIFENGFYHT